MRGKKLNRKKIAKEMPAEEIANGLAEIGATIQELRKEITANRDDFAYEINVARSAMQGYENGRDMLLSTFLKILYGLDQPPEDFFKKINDPKRKI